MPSKSAKSKKKKQEEAPPPPKKPSSSNSKSKSTSKSKSNSKSKSSSSSSKPAAAKTKTTTQSSSSSSKPSKPAAKTKKQTSSSSITPTPTPAPRPAPSRHLSRAFLRIAPRYRNDPNANKSSANLILRDVRAEVRKLDPPGVSAYQKKAKEEEDANKDDNSPESKRIALGADAYSIMMLHGFGAVSLWSFTILCIQMVFITLFYYDLLKDSTENNVFNLPSHQSWHMKIVQFLALLVVPYFLGDVTAALIWLGMRYEPVPGFPQCTRRRWYWVLFLRVAVGTALVFVAFLLVMQSTSLQILFLNVQAILFVGQVDDIFIWLAYHGFLREQMEQATRTVEEVGMTRRIETRKAIRGVLMVALWLMLILGWSFVSMSYSSNVYLMEESCTTFTVIMDDVPTGSAVYSDLEYNANSTKNLIAPETQLRYTYFSGTYRIGLLDPAGEKDEDEPKRLISRFDTIFPEVINDRLVYYQDFDQERPDDSPEYERFPYQGKFSFCADSEAGGDTSIGWWIFSVENIQPDRDESDDACPGWLMRSPLTEKVYTLQEVASSPAIDEWEVWTTAATTTLGTLGRIEKVQDLQLACDDCEAAVDCGFKGTCEPDSDDIYETCDCEDDRLGHRCEVGMNCRNLEVTPPGNEDGIELTPYTRITKEGTRGDDGTVADELLTIAGRPVFVNFNGNENLNTAAEANATLEAVFYAATRWYHGSIPAQVMLDDVVGLHRSDLHPIWDGFVLFDVDYGSDPTRRGSPTATQLSWYPVEIIRNTLGLAIDYLVHDDGLPVGDIVNCRLAQNPIAEPFFDTAVLCDPTFLSFNPAFGTCPQDLTDLTGRVESFEDGGNFDIIPYAELLFDNNDDTMVSVVPTEAGTNYVFGYRLADTYDLTFSGYTVRFGPNTNLNLVSVSAYLCQDDIDPFDYQNCAGVGVEASIASRIFNVQFPEDVREQTWEALSLARMTFAFAYRAVVSENTIPLEIEEIRVYGFTGL